MSIQSILSPVSRPSLGLTSNAANIKSSGHGLRSAGASEVTELRGVEHLRSELKARGANAATQMQPSERLLANLGKITRPDHQPPGLLKKLHADTATTPSAAAFTPPRMRSSDSTPTAVMPNSSHESGMTIVNESAVPVPSIREESTSAKIAEAQANVSHVEENTASNQSSKPLYEITVEGLMANWGKSDSIYDLTGSGTVDGEDLLLLLSNGGTMMVEMPEDMPIELTLEGLLAAWGSSNSHYDLNGDGTVGGEDLLLFLQKFHDGEQA
jgi:hypothetical protein